MQIRYRRFESDRRLISSDLPLEIEQASFSPAVYFLLLYCSSLSFFAPKERESIFIFVAIILRAPSTVVFTLRIFARFKHRPTYTQICKALFGQEAGIIQISAVEDNRLFKQLF